MTKINTTAHVASNLENLPDWLNWAPKAKLRTLDHADTQLPEVVKRALAARLTSDELRQLVEILDTKV